MPAPGSHTTKRSSIELEVIKFLRQHRSATPKQVHAAVGKRTLNATQVLLKKLHDEGYIAREFVYEARAGQNRGSYHYVVA